MNDQVLRLGDVDAEDSRFARFELIGWWDQDKLNDARVVVIGAGAIGNELIKNLALLGVGQLFIADIDLIEHSNLSRSVLFRESDCGRRKSEVAAERAGEIYPDIRTTSFYGNIVHDLGLGVYRWADVILGGLDNREARVAVNAAAARTGRTWIDGAIERLDGVARVFHPASGPCYECTMSEVDWKMLEARRSCALLSRDEMEQGKVPTTPTTSSVVAGVQVQEAVKLIHGLETLAGGGFVFDGSHHQSYTVTYSRLEDCPAHESHEPIELLESGTGDITAGELMDRVRGDLGPEAVIEFNSDLLESLTCPGCQHTEPMLASLGSVTESDGRCPECQQHRIPNLYHSIGHDSELLDRTLEQLGVPAWDIVGGRAGWETRYYELSGDRNRVLGPLDDQENRDE